MTRIIKNRKVMLLADAPAMDRECWEEALAGGEDGDGPALDWEPDTQGKTWRAWGRLLQWQSAIGELSPGLHPRERATKPTLKAFTAAMEEDGLAPHSVGMILMDIANALRVMAPEEDWAWVRRLSRRVTRDAVSVRDPATTLVDPTLIYRLGIQIMRDADSAARYGEGLILALLALVPALRSRAVRSLRTDDLTFATGQYRLTIRAKTKKGKRRTHSVPLPSEITSYMDRWLHDHRRTLIDPTRPTDILLLTGVGNPYSRAKLWEKVANHTEKGIGNRVGPHRIRHCAATWIAIRTPEHVMDTRYVLDHASHNTGQDNYNLSGSLEASRRHSETMLDVIESGCIDPPVALDQSQGQEDNPPIRFHRPRRATGTSS
jgi:integrase/recombinase XerD